MKEADVGFAMGISGTQIAMNASDIILLDDNFVSIVQSIRWGRNVLNSVRKFLQFQLAVNLVAIIVTFIGSIAVGSSPLNTIQLLWVNLIMDSLGALGLATDEPDQDILDHPPHSRFEPLLSVPMKEYIVSQVVYQLIVLLGLFFGLEHFLPLTSDRGVDSLKRIDSVVFTTFVFLQCTNEIMARQLNGEVWIFRNFFRNKTFLLILVIIILVQSIVVTVGQSFIGTVTMTSTEWLICVIASLINLPFIFVYRCLFLLYHKYYPIESKNTKKDAALEEDPLAKVASRSGSKDEIVPMQKIKKSAAQDETAVLIKSDKDSRENRNAGAPAPVPLGSKSRSGSLVEMIHPFRKDSNPLPIKNGTSRSSLSLRESAELLAGNNS